MSEAIIVAIIVGSFTLAGTILTIVLTNRKTRLVFEGAVNTYQAVTNEKIENLTTEVRKHNCFAERIPKLEGQVETLMKHET